MSETRPLTGRVIAIVGTGTDLDRAIAVACAEAGADIALGAATPAREHEYGMNSIANEIWALGREQFVRVLDAPERVEELVREARKRLGRCDALVAADGSAVDVPVAAPRETATETLGAIVELLPAQPDHTPPR